VSAGTVLTNVNNTIFGASGIGRGRHQSYPWSTAARSTPNVNTTSGKLVIDLPQSDQQYRCFGKRRIQAGSIC